ncbi:hypothetical protein BGZ58_001161, partial [Dissophora ornata]
MADTIDIVGVEDAEEEAEDELKDSLLPDRVIRFLDRTMDEVDVDVEGEDDGDENVRNDEDEADGDVGPPSDAVNGDAEDVPEEFGEGAIGGNEECECEVLCVFVVDAAELGLVTIEGGLMVEDFCVRDTGED